MARAKTKTFEVTLAGRKGEPETTVEVQAAFMLVNHRGDLLFSEQRNTYGDTLAIACYRTRSWLNAKVKPEGEASDA